MLTRAHATTIRKPPFRSHQIPRLQQLSWNSRGSTTWLRYTSVVSDAHNLQSSPGSVRSPRRAPSRSISTSAEGFQSPQANPLPLFGMSYPTPPPSLTWPDNGPIIINPQVQGSRVTLGATPGELVQNLRACLTVGKLDRAEEILRRIVLSGTLSVGELQEANNMYIRSMVHALFMRAENADLQKLQCWFEFGMRQSNISPDATTFALLNRAAFTLGNANSRERTIRRYLSMAEVMGVLDETLESGEYLPHEWNELCRIRKDYFDEMPEEEPIAAQATSPVAVTKVEINATTQSGLGLRTLLQGIRSLHSRNGTFDTADQETKRQWQLQLEEDLVNAELQRWELEHKKMQKMGINPALSDKSMEALLWEWQTKLDAALREYLKQIQDKKHALDWVRGKALYLDQIPPEKLAAITILTILRLVTKSGLQECSSRAAINEIGDCLEAESLANNRAVLNDMTARRVNNVRRSRTLQQILKVKSRSKRSKAPTASHLSVAEEGSLEWPIHVKMETAAILISKLIEIAKFPAKSKSGKDKRTSKVEMEAALSHENQWISGKQRGIIRLHSSFADLIRTNPPSPEMALQIPMIAEPDPWSSSRGAYLRIPAPLVRFKDPYGLQHMYVRAALENGDMERVLSGLNMLSKIPWKINKQVFDVMVDVWNTGEPLTNFPPANPVVHLPLKPDASVDAITMWKWRRQMREAKNLHAGYQSNRCFINQQLEIARGFLDYKLYFPHNLDFRGRVYPVAGILNHMGADNARALFMFADGKELGECGLDWLKVQLANTYGFNKGSFAERQEFAMKNLANMRDSVENPLGGNRWWMTAEDPYQCLACCFELLAAMDSPDPTKFVSHLPVYQDGTCNGLQHYAALGGDMLGAAQVNLIPRDRPADIYSEVANLVQEEIEKDEKLGEPMAKALHGHISRKVVKHPVMTNVYGVTFYGAIKQVEKQLDDMFPSKSVADIPTSKLAVYIAKKIFKVFGNMFAGATQIQKWLGDCAGIISTSVSPEQVEKAKARLQPDAGAMDGAKKPKWQKKLMKKSGVEFQSAVVWTTPLRFPVVQPYRDLKKRLISTEIQHINLTAPSNTLSILKRKQMQGFPPNFIHSLDAAHMMLSAINCTELGLTFASVHDSFWTHACDVPVMSKVLRSTFIEMHQENIIGRLNEELMARHKDFMQMLSIPLHSPLGKRIKAFRMARYLEKRRAARRANLKMTSASTASISEELVEEYERFKLLRSEDPEERKKGEEMVTPGSLYAAVGPDSPDLLVAESQVKEPLPSSPSLAADQPTFSDTEALVDADKAEEVETEGAESASKQKNARSQTYVKIWVPIAFPPVPEKGDFDVAMLKNSQYFFS